MNDQERLLDLMVARATEGLPESESSELDAMLAGQMEFQSDDFDLAAAEIDLALDSGGPCEEMPAPLKRRVLASAADYLPAAPAGNLGVPRFPPSPPSRSERPAKQGSMLGWTGWAVAAAVLMLMILGPWRDDPSVAAVQGPAELRQVLIDSAADLVQVAWARPEILEYEQVRGDVVWSNARQMGYMRLEGLPVNVPTQAQYQLWIVDPTRDAKPIDGGVFDIASDGTAIVPIDAKLLVNDPQAFAITLEQPGGVVVSDGPLLVVAAVTS